MRPQLALIEALDHDRSNQTLAHTPGSACKVGRFNVIDEIKETVDNLSIETSTDSDAMSFLCKPRLTLHINHSPVASPRNQIIYQSVHESSSPTIHPANVDFSSTAPLPGWLTPNDLSNNLSANQSNNSSRKSSVGNSPQRDPRRFSYPPISISQSHSQSFNRISALTPVSQSSFFDRLEKRRAYQPRRGIDLTLDTGKWFRTKFSVKLENPPLEETINQSIDQSTKQYQILVYELDALSGTTNLLGSTNQSSNESSFQFDDELVAWQCQTSDCHLLLRLIDQSNNQSVVGVATCTVSWLIESHASHTIRFHHPSDQSINQSLDHVKTSVSFQLNHLTCYQSVHSLAEHIHESSHIRAAVLAYNQSNNQTINHSNFLCNLASPSPVVRSITA